LHAFCERALKIQRPKEVDESMEYNKDVRFLVETLLQKAISAIVCN